MLYIDFQYDDTNLDEARPQVFKVNATNLSAIKAGLTAALVGASITETVGGLSGGRLWANISAGTTTTVDPGTGSKQNVVEFLGFSRIDGFPMFRDYRQANAVSNFSGAVPVAPFVSLFASLI